MARRILTLATDVFAVLFLLFYIGLIVHGTVMPTEPTLHRQFQSGAMFAMTDNGMLLIQVGADYDVTKKQLDKMLGGSTSWADLPFNSASTPLYENMRVWRVANERQFNQVFQTYFRPYQPVEEVRFKPTIHAIGLVPFTLDQPLIANDFAEKH